MEIQEQMKLDAQALSNVGSFNEETQQQPQIEVAEEKKKKKKRKLEEDAIVNFLLFLMDFMRNFSQKPRKKFKKR